MSPVEVVGTVAAAVQTHQVGWSPSTYILSGILLTLVTGLCGGLVAWIKTRPTIEKQRDDTDAGIRSELIRRLEAADAKMVSLDNRVKQAETHSSAVDLRVGQFEFVLRLVIEELERKDPGNAVAAQARMLLAAAYPVHPVPGDMQATILRAGREGP
jgi:hypothetical protein